MLSSSGLRRLPSGVSYGEAHAYTALYRQIFHEEREVLDFVLLVLWEQNEQQRSGVELPEAPSPRTSVFRPRIQLTPVRGRGLPLQRPGQRTPTNPLHTLLDTEQPLRSRRPRFWRMQGSMQSILCKSLVRTMIGLSSSKKRPLKRMPPGSEACLRQLRSHMGDSSYLRYTIVQAPQADLFKVCFGLARCWSEAREASLLAHTLARHEELPDVHLDWRLRSLLRPTDVCPGLRDRSPDDRTAEGGRGAAASGEPSARPLGVTTPLLRLLRRVFPQFGPETTGGRDGSNDSAPLAVLSPPP